MNDNKKNNKKLKKYSSKFILASSILLPSTFISSCSFDDNSTTSSSSISNSNLKCTINIDYFGQTNFKVNNKYKIKANINTDINYKVIWECSDKDLKLETDNEYLTFSSSVSKRYSIKVKVVDENNNILSEKIFDLFIEKINYNLTIDIQNKDYYLNDLITINSNLNPNNDNYYYVWDIEGKVYQDYNFKSINHQFSKLGQNYISLKVYEDNTLSTLVSEQITYVNVINKPEPVYTPTDYDLKISNDFKNTTGRYDSRLWKSKYDMLRDLNNYGVLNSFTLVTKIYYLNVFEYNGFKDTRFELIKKTDTEFVYKMSGTSTREITKWGKELIFPSLLEGWSGLEVKPNDYIEVEIKYSRNNVPQDPNKFSEDLSKTIIGGAISTSRPPKFNKVYDGYVTNMFYTNEFDGYCKLTHNGNVVKGGTTRNNRVLLAYMYESPVEPGIYVFGDNYCRKR